MKEKMIYFVTVLVVNFFKSLIILVQNNQKDYFNFFKT